MNITTLLVQKIFLVPYFHGVWVNRGSNILTSPPKVTPLINGKRKFWSEANDLFPLNRVGPHHYGNYSNFHNTTKLWENAPHNKMTY